MRLQMAFNLLAVSACAVLAAPLSAEQSSSKPAKDPNARICEDLSMVGSRLAVRRVCATRAEWEEKRRLDRDAIDQAQRSPCVLAQTGKTGKPGC